MADAFNSRRWLRPIIVGGMISIFAAGAAIAASPQALDPASIAGKYHIWEDHEGGRVCDITLEDGEILGGFALQSDEPCFEKLGFEGDPFAWFVDEQTNEIVVIDVTRAALVRFAVVPDGSFYANRVEEGLESLNLTPE